MTILKIRWAQEEIEANMTGYMAMPSFEADVKAVKDALYDKLHNGTISIWHTEPQECELRISRWFESCSVYVSGTYCFEAENFGYAVAVVKEAIGNRYDYDIKTLLNTNSCTVSS